MTARLEYWDASLSDPRWVEARIEYGTGNYSNACLSVVMTSSLGRPTQATVRLANSNWQNNLSNNGPFTNKFTDFQRVRLLDDDLNIVLFHGRIYGISAKNDKQYGKLVELTCWDLLRELQDYPTSHLDTVLNYGTGTGEFQSGSDLIELLIASGYTHKSSMELPSTSIDLSDTGANGAANDGKKFRGSAVNFHGGMKDTYNFSKGSAKNALAHISAIARQEPHSAADMESTFGYDYFVDPRFDRSTDYTTSTSATLRGDSFNYFKRGTQPASVTAGGTTGGNWRGLKITYPSASFTEGGNNTAMMDDSSFEYPKEQLYTSAIIRFDLDTRITKTLYNNAWDYANYESWMYEDGYSENQPVQPALPHNGRFLAEVLTGGTFGGSSGRFKYEGREWHDEFNAQDDTRGSYAEKVVITHTHSATNSDHYETNHGSGSAHPHAVGRIQYQDNTSGVGMVLLSMDDEEQIQFFNKMCNEATGTLVITTSTTSVATYTFTPSSHRLKDKFGIQRPYKIDVSSSTNLDAMRQEAANALSKSAFPQITGRFRTLRAPYYYVELSCADSNDANAFTPTHINGTAVSTTFNLLTHGIKRGMTVAAIDSNGDQTAWGWITNLSSDNSAVSGGSIEITAPIRAADADSASAAIPVYTNASWDNYTSSQQNPTIRVYIPVQTGHYTYVKNESQNIDGYHFIDDINYTELQGAIGTVYKTYGTNATTGAYEGPHKHELPQVLVEIDDTAREIGSLADIPVGLLPWTYQQSSTSGHTATFSITSRRDITWTGGILSIGGLYSYKIKAGSVELALTTTDQSDNSPIEYILSFDPDQTPDSNGFYSLVFTARGSYIDDMDKLRMGWARAGASVSDPAILEFGGNTTIGDLSMKSIGSSLMHKGAQGFTSTMDVKKKASSPAWNKVEWGQFNIKFSDGSSLTVTSDDYTFTDTNSRQVYYMFVTIPESGNATLDFDSNYLNAFGDTRVNVGVVVVEANADSADVDAPSVFPVNSKSAVVSAGLVEANHLSAITANIGGITSGRVVTGTNSTAFHTGPSNSASSFTGVAMGQPGTGTYGVGTDIVMRAQKTGTDILRLNSGSGTYAGQMQFGLGTTGSNSTTNTSFVSQDGVILVTDNSSVPGSGAGNNRIAWYHGAYNPASIYTNRTASIFSSVNNTLNSLFVQTEASVDINLKAGYSQGWVIIKTGAESSWGNAVSSSTSGIHLYTGTAIYPRYGGSSDLGTKYHALQAGNGGAEAFQNVFAGGYFIADTGDNVGGTGEDKQATLRDTTTYSTTYHERSDSNYGPVQGQPSQGILQGKKLWNDNGILKWGTTAVGGQVGNSFTTIAVSGESNIVADQTSDTLTFAEGKGIVIATNASSDTLTVTNSLFDGGENFDSSYNLIRSYEMAGTGVGQYFEMLSRGTVAMPILRLKGNSSSSGQYSPRIQLARSKSGSNLAGTTALADNDDIGQINYIAYSSSGAEHTLGQITVIQAGAAPAGNNAPGTRFYIRSSKTSSGVASGTAGTYQFVLDEAYRVGVHTLAKNWFTVGEYSFVAANGISGSNAAALGGSSNGYAAYIYGNGYVTGSWTSNSDERIKENVVTITGSAALTKLRNLNPVTYDWATKYTSANPAKQATSGHGFLANEFGTIFSDGVKTSELDLIKKSDNTYRMGEALEAGETIDVENLKGIDPTIIIPYLVASIKDLEARIIVLEGG